MSDAATPEGAPADGGTDATIAAAMALIEKDQGDGGDSDAAGADARQATAAAEPAADPTPGDDDSATPDPDTQPTAPEPTYRVKVRGEEREVTLTELRNGYSRTEDYKAKTAEIAQQRQAVERAGAEALARIQRLDQLISMAPLDPILAEGMQTDWARLAQEDPLTHTQRRGAFDERMQRLQAVVTERQRMTQEQTRQQFAGADETLRAKLPEWGDREKQIDLQRRIKDMALKSYGFEPADLKGVTDPRLVLLMRDALAYHEQKAARATVDAKRVAPAPVRVMRPGGGVGNSTSGSEKARALAAKAIRTNRTSDQVAAAMAILES